MVRSACRSSVLFAIMKNQNPSFIPLIGIIDSFSKVWCLYMGNSVKLIWVTFIRCGVVLNFAAHANILVVWFTPINDTMNRWYSNRLCYVMNQRCQSLAILIGQTLYLGVKAGLLFGACPLYLEIGVWSHNYFFCKNGFVKYTQGEICWTNYFFNSIQFFLFHSVHA